MKVKFTLSIAAWVLLTSVSCRNASFQNVDDVSASKFSGDDSANTGSGDGAVEQPVIASPLPGADVVPDLDTVPTLGSGNSKGSDPGQGNPTTAAKLILTVTTPSPEIKPGGQKITAVATLKDEVDPPSVKWVISGPSAKTDIGSIDPNGVYTSPQTNDKDFPVTITAILNSDPSVTASTVLTVLAGEQIFSRCTRGNKVFPILADVFEINSSATRLPDFSNSAEARKVTTVCMDKYAVAPRNFEAGFPDVPGLFEFFALQTTTTLIIPVDGDYVLQLNSDDGAKLYIDGILVIDNDGTHQALGSDPLDSTTVGRKEKTVRIKKGNHALSLDYFQGPKVRIALELKWKTPGSNSFVYIPTESFK